MLVRRDIAEDKVTGTAGEIVDEMCGERHSINKRAGLRHGLSLFRKRSLFCQISLPHHKGLKRPGL